MVAEKVRTGAKLRRYDIDDLIVWMTLHRCFFAGLKVNILKVITDNPFALYLMIVGENHALVENERIVFERSVIGTRKTIGKTQMCGLLY